MCTFCDKFLFLYSGTRRLSENLVASSDPALLCAKALQHLVGDSDNKVVQNVRRRSRTFELGQVCFDGLVGFPPQPDDVLTPGRKERAKLKLSAENVAVQLEHVKMQDLAWVFYSIWMDVVNARLVSYEVRHIPGIYNKCPYRRETKGTVQFIPRCRYCPSEVTAVSNSYLQFRAHDLPPDRAQLLRLQSSGMSDEDLIKVSLRKSFQSV
jgi:hypothetical protein